VRWALALVLLPAVALAGGFGGKFGSPRGRGGVRTPPVVLSSVVGYGDSIMAGTGGGSPLVTLRPLLGAEASAYNAGVPGDSSGGILARWLSGEATACGVARCTHAWFEGGTNDLRAVNPAQPADVVANMAAAVDDALAKGYTVIWSDVLPCRGYVDASDATAARILAYNALMATACAALPRGANPRLHCLFTYAAFEDPERPGYLLPAYSNDELHLSSAGAAALGTLASAALGL
jgi:lysophospholipase L1-like esterase